ncbi:MAG: CRISPR-associated endonuclease Cas2 [Nitrososphaerota archaeon]|nr:CRISPR-associated endonuclease Cas2 [Nitrososphaerota archaeon]
MRGWYLVCYDIRDEARLRRVQKLMLGYGHRLQYSIFRCRLSERDVERMKWELMETMETEDDLLVVGLCKACVGRLRVNGSHAPWPKEGPSYEIV